MIEKLKDHFVAHSDLHRAVRTVASERDIDMTDLVDEILRKEPAIKNAMRRIKTH